MEDSARERRFMAQPLCRIQHGDGKERGEVMEVTEEDRVDDICQKVGRQIFDKIAANPTCRLSIWAGTKGWFPLPLPGGLIPFVISVDDGVVDREVPVCEVEGLLCPEVGWWRWWIRPTPSEHNACVREAYRCGQKSGRRCHHDEIPNGSDCPNCGATALRITVPCPGKRL